MDVNAKYSKEFDNMHTMRAYIDLLYERHGNRLAVINKKGEHNSEKSFTQLKQDSLCIAMFLKSKNLFDQPIALIGTLSYEWLVVFLGIMSSGNIAVPIDKDLNGQDIIHLMRQVDTQALYVDAKMINKASFLKNELNHIEVFISNGDLAGYDNIHNHLDKADNPNDIIIDPDQIGVIVFTSGTTGTSKAVALSHKNICDNICCSVQLLEDAFKPGQHNLAVLPPHHMFEITAGILTALYYGMVLCVGGGAKYFSVDIKEYKPMVLVVVPLIVESMYKRICIEINKSGKEKLFKRAIKISKLLRKIGIDIRKILFKDIHDKLGGKLEIIVSGGAFLEPYLVEKFDEFGISLRNGYGISECSPVVACNMAKRTKFGSVGVIAPKPYCEVKIDEGEVLVKGSIVMKEYYKDSVSTEQAFKNEWFKTGDLGYIEDDYLFITGRKKNLIILSDGNNISPEELESYLGKLPLVQSVFVCTKKSNSLLVITACIYPNYEYAKESGISDINVELEKEIAQINSLLPLYKRIQKFVLFNEDFEKTSLGKIKRFKYD